jgi:hypothetical protein
MIEAAALIKSSSSYVVVGLDLGMDGSGWKTCAAGEGEKGEEGEESEE